MSDEQNANQPQKQSTASMPIVLGLALVVIATINEGPLRWVLYTVALGMLVYAVILARKSKRREGA